MTTINEQRAAIARASKELKRELIKAKQSENTEWVEEVERDIKLLDDAVETMKLVEQLSLLIVRVTQ